MYGEAESQFERLRRSGTYPIDAVRGLSAVLRAQGRPAAAERLIGQALHDNSDNPSLRRELGYIAYNRGGLDRAAEIFGRLVEKDPYSITDRRWLAASLRQAKKYSQAQAVLDAAPEMNHHGLDLERGWVAYAEGNYARAADHFRAAKAHGAQPDSFVPPLVKALLRMDRGDDAQAETADVRLTSSIAAALADIQVHKGFPRDAIDLMFKLRAQLDENGLTQLVTLLLGAERDEEARDVFREWLRERGLTGTRTRLSTLRHPSSASGLSWLAGSQIWILASWPARWNPRLSVMPDPIPSQRRWQRPRSAQCERSIQDKAKRIVNRAPRTAVGAR